MQPNEREQPIVSFVFGFAVGESGQPAEASPVGCARIGTVASRERLGGEGAEEFGEHGDVFEPGLEIAAAGLDDGTRLEAFGGEPGELGFIKVVKHGVPVVAGGPEVNVRAPCVATPEQGSRSRTAEPVIASRPGSMPRLLRTPTS